ncbi:hypothetical protein N1851_008050 [Merluccius polli]|uniref:Uncharacterized protein n=1 Tax=Merluccius polli TaxID=89951 RepID=A0AA47N3A1_MERPO|nr:hypothetical protein N1851_008050 [Merluccius polli]
MSQVPIVDRTTEQTDPQEDSDTDELVEENSNEPEIQQENILQEDDQQSEDEQQPAAAAQDEVPASPHPDSDEEEREQEHYLPQRERQAPKIFTYDQLGTPACYSATIVCCSVHRETSFD